MIDHLIAAPDAATMAMLLQPHGLASLDQNNNPQFAANIILNIGGPNDQSIRVILSEAVWNKSDPDPKNWTITTPEVLAPGFFVIVAQPALDPTLRDLPGNACRLIADRDAADRGDPSVLLYTAPDMDPALLSSARVEPTPSMRGQYPFGVK